MNPEKPRCGICGHQEGDKVMDDLPDLPERFGPVVNGECDLCRTGREFNTAEARRAQRHQN